MSSFNNNGNNYMGRNHMATYDFEDLNYEDPEGMTEGNHAPIGYIDHMNNSDFDEESLNGELEVYLSPRSSSRPNPPATAVAPQDPRYASVRGPAMSPAFSNANVAAGDRRRYIESREERHAPGNLWPRPQSASNTVSVPPRATANNAMNFSGPTGDIRQADANPPRRAVRFSDEDLDSYPMYENPISTGRQGAYSMRENEAMNSGYSARSSRRSSFRSMPSRQSRNQGPEQMVVPQSSVARSNSHTMNELAPLGSDYSSGRWKLDEGLLEQIQMGDWPENLIRPLQAIPPNPIMTETNLRSAHPPQGTGNLVRVAVNTQMLKRDNSVPSSRVPPNQHRSYQMPSDSRKIAKPRLQRPASQGHATQGASRSNMTLGFDNGPQTQHQYLSSQGYPKQPYYSGPLSPSPQPSLNQPSFNQTSFNQHPQRLPPTTQFPQFQRQQAQSGPQFRPYIQPNLEFGYEEEDEEEEEERPRKRFR